MNEGARARSCAEPDGTKSNTRHAKTQTPKKPNPTHPSHPLLTPRHALAIVRDALHPVHRLILRQLPAVQALEHVDEVEPALVVREALGL